MKFGIPFIVISRFMLINFQTNPMITVNFFTFVHELLDSPSYMKVNGYKDSHCDCIQDENCFTGQTQIVDHNSVNK